MDDVKLPDLSNIRGLGGKRELPPQASAEDTSNWDNRAIALPNPNRPYAEFIFGDNDNDLDLLIVRPIHSLNKSGLRPSNARNSPFVDIREIC